MLSFRKFNLPHRQAGIKKDPKLFILALFLFCLIFTSVSPVYAQVPVTDVGNLTESRIQNMMTRIKNTVTKAGSKALQDAVRNALNRLAFDAANKLATGARGQKPQFIKESWGEYLKSAADNVAGTVIEELGKENSFKEFNLCEPRLDVKMSIGLGLVNQQRPQQPNCTFSQMYNNWKSEADRLKAMNNKDFLKIFQQSFNPSGNDLGIALSLQTQIIEQQQAKLNEEGLQFAANGSNRDARNASGNLLGIPGFAQNTIKAVQNKLYSSVGTFTGDALVDAAKVFLNQLAVATFNKKLENLGNIISKTSSPYNYEGALNNSRGAAEYLREIVEPKFNTRGDYDIISSLSSCDKIGEYAPTTGCVIDEKFAEAIKEKKTIIQAINEGLLSKDAPFGFRIAGNTAIEPDYNQGYPYRSMAILRKYRIIPIGWEAAAIQLSAQMKADSSKAKNATLEKMIECFDQNDSYGNFYEDWCKGMVDPNWVLKAPQNYCAKEGYGPELISDEINDNGNGKSTRQVIRDDTYCGDEQSCIDENEDGSCNNYGYCTSEKRTWNFGADKCEPKFNTCQSFKSSEGKTVSYLENTLEFCDSANAGCKGYALPSGYDLNRGRAVWGATLSYLNSKAESCDSKNEGCTELVRLISTSTPEQIESAGLDTVLNNESVRKETVYEKILPAYLESICYDSGTQQLKDADKDGNPDQAICSLYARKCEQKEVGCKSYTSQTDGFSVPAKISENDSCAEECVGYDTYIQSATTYETEKSAYFIPSTAKKCQATAVGCDAFTNLDNPTQGGEQKEYYSYLRRCLKPDSGSCGEFYTWEGSDETGYQLKLFNLQKNGEEPLILNSELDKQCTKNIYKLPTSSNLHNPDCREFYSRDGTVSYHLYSQTVSCSNDCHPYRLEADGNTVMAIPSESKKCNASQSGCREYTGNQGNNTQNIAYFDFEGSISGWSGGEQSTESIRAGGRSLKANANSVSSPAINGAVQGVSYSLSFIAKSSSDISNLNISLIKGTEKNEFSPVNIKAGDWNIYQTNLQNLNLSGTSLLIEANGIVNNLFVDEIKLTAVTDRYYLIRNSWNTPQRCYENSKGEYIGELYNLGCDKYKDSEDKILFLKSFSELCQDSAVGCELMVDPDQNKFTYAVYDQNKLCNQADKGCMLLGMPYKYDGKTIYSETYIKNNSKNSDAICAADQEGCMQWSNADGNEQVSFIDPGDMVCEWRQQKNSTNWGWFKKNVNYCFAKRCGGSGNVCSSDKDCGSGVKCIAGNQSSDSTGNICVSDNNCEANQKCQLNETDQKCETDKNSAPKTIGYGGGGARVSQPIKVGRSNWVGICAPEQSGCTEYIDPVSNFSVNLIQNGKVALQPNTLYTLKGTINCGSNSSLNILGANNNFGSATNAIDQNAVFFNFSTSEINCAATGSLKKAIVEYRINKNNEINQGECNGAVEFVKGCILLNERKVAGKNLAGLSYDANVASEGKAPQAGINNSNKVIQVNPDRVCGQWLSCRSYVKNTEGKPVCFDVGLCDSLDANGNCDDFVPSANMGQYKDNWSNWSGYSLPSGMPISKMNQVGSVVELSNGGFELAGTNGYPVGWNNISGIAWNENVFKVLNDASLISSELGKNNMPPEGNNILRVGPGAKVASEELNLSSQDNYILTAYIDTRALSNTGSGYGRISLSSTESSNYIDMAPGFKGYRSMIIANPNPNDKIILQSRALGGYIYFDDIKIKPALSTDISKYSNQICRLYPKEDALSCRYADNSGVIQSGLSGYCLQYDRLPGSSDSCLLWYPVDKVKGEGIEENAGYKGKYPLYYCTQVDNSSTDKFKLKIELNADDQALMYIDNKTKPVAYVRSNGKNVNTLSPDLSIGKHAVTIIGANKSEGGNTMAYIEAKIEDPSSIRLDPMITSIDKQYGWKCATLPNTFNPDYSTYNFYDINYSYGSNDGLIWDDPSYVGDSMVIYDASRIWEGEQNSDGTYQKGAKIVCRTIIDIKPVCKKFVEVVSASGDNKVYQSKLSGADDQFVTVNNAPELKFYSDKAYFNTNSNPYGTINYPEPAFNPYEWDASDDEGIQPLIYNTDAKKPNMGQYYQNTDTVNSYKGELQKLFAQSYGAYRLSNGICTGSGGNAEGSECSAIQQCPGSYCQMKNVSPKVCNDSSENAGEDCEVTTCSSGSCILSTTGDNNMRCNGNGQLCCTPKKTCDGVNCCVNNKCNIGNNLGGYCVSDLYPRECMATSEYKCNESTRSDCCMSGVCSRVCSNNSHQTCSNDDQCKTVIGNKKYCESNKKSCNSQKDVNCLITSGMCSTNTLPCDSDSDCPGGYCDGVTYENCITEEITDNAYCVGSTKCVGGDNHGYSCSTATAACSGQGECKQVYKVAGSQEECCPLTPQCAQKSEEYGYCFDGTKKGQPCSGNVCDNGTCVGAGQYILDNNFQNWYPKNLTVGTAPTISNPKLSASSIIKNGFVSLTFNSTVNPDQLPLIEYTVDWGDGTKTTLSGSEMNSRPDTSNPHEVFHLYSYWELISNGICKLNNPCVIIPKIQIRDNWGWCNGGTPGAHCPNSSFVSAPTIKITEQ